MTRLAVFLVLLVLAPLAQAQRPDRPGGYTDQRPRWCQGYDWRDYRRDMRQCRNDWECKRRVERRAERCGLRG